MRLGAWLGSLVSVDGLAGRREGGRAEVSRPDREPRRSTGTRDGRVITVGPTQVAGRLQEALLRLRDGDTLVLRPGVYEGGARLQGRRDVTVRGEPGAIVTGRGRADYGLRVVGSAGVTLEGLTFRDCGLDGIRADATTRLTIRRCEAGHAGGSGFALVGCADVRIENCYAHHNGLAGIAVEGAGDRLSVVGCRVLDNVGDGLALDPAIDARAPGVLIAGNVLARNF